MEKNNFICNICENKYKSIKSLILHVGHSHGLSSKSYYDAYYRKPSEGICPVCGKETKFHNFKKGYLTYCSNICSSKSSTVRQKIKNTCIEKYGTENPAQSNIIKQKIIETNLKKYGTKCTFEVEEIKQKSRQTCLDKYGVEYPAQSKEIIDKAKQTCLLRYGVDNFAKTLNYSEYMNSCSINHYSLNTDKYGEIINISNDNNTITFKCNICGKITTSNRLTFQGRALYRNTNPCQYCEPLYKHNSLGEKELLNFIKTIYNGIIIENDRTILNGKEIDIYLPDKKLAFEFDGTFWHADPRFYDENDIIINEKTAKEIWKKDIFKNKLCEQNGITLIHINEYDWNNDKNIKENIINIIKQ